MVNELVARVIVAGRTEAALRAARERQLIGTGGRPAPIVRRSRRTTSTRWPVDRPGGKRRRSVLVWRSPTADLVETATKHSAGTFRSDTCGAHVITRSVATGESRFSCPKEIWHEPERFG